MPKLKSTFAILASILSLLAGCTYPIDSKENRFEILGDKGYRGTLDQSSGKLEIDMDGRRQTGQVRFERQRDGSLKGTLLPTDGSTLTCELIYVSASRSGGGGQCSTPDGKIFSASFWSGNWFRM